MAFYLFIQFIVSFTASIAQAISVLSSFPDYPAPGAATFAAGISFGIPLIWFGFCLLILRTSDRIAGWIIRDDGEFGARLSLSLKELQILGYNLIGLFLIAQSFPGILNLSARLRVEAQTGYIIPEIIALSAQLVIGLALFFGSRGLANLWSLFQEKTRSVK